MKSTKNFYYRKSCKILQWGCCFDSITEMKYTMSIQEEYRFLRNRVMIYYNQRTLMPTDYIREGVKRYTPDFIIRNIATGKAYLVEVKPRDFETQFQKLEQLRQIAENYIQWKGYDWEFKVVYDDQIILDEYHQHLFKDCRRLIGSSALKRYVQELDQKYNRSAPTLFIKPPREQDIRFVLFGKNS